MCILNLINSYVNLSSICLCLKCSNLVFRNLSLWIALVISLIDFFSYIFIMLNKGNHRSDMSIQGVGGPPL